MTGSSDFLSQPFLNGVAKAHHGSEERQFGTLAVHAGAPHDPTTGAVIAPVSSRCLRYELFMEQRTDIITSDLPLNDLCSNQCWKARWIL